MKLVATVLKACPDQLRPFLATLEQHWRPRISKMWPQIMHLLIKIFKFLDFPSIFDYLDTNVRYYIQTIHCKLCL